jgi:hypothetical protein
MSIQDALITRTHLTFRHTGFTIFSDIEVRDSKHENVVYDIKTKHGLHQELSIHDPNTQEELLLAKCTTLKFFPVEVWRNNEHVATISLNLLHSSLTFHDLQDDQDSFTVSTSSMNIRRGDVEIGKIHFTLTSFWIPIEFEEDENPLYMTLACLLTQKW